METGSKYGKVIPTNFGLKYNPPKLGIQYYFKENPKATFVHEVTLEDVDSKENDELVNDLFAKHKKFIDPKVVSRNQLENLMDRLRSHTSITHEKENIVTKAPEPVNKLVSNNKSAKAEEKTKAEEKAKVIDDDWGLDLDDNDDQRDDPLSNSHLDKENYLYNGNSASKDDDLNSFEFGQEDHKINNDKHMEPSSPGQSQPDQNDDNEEEGDDDDDAIDIDNEEELAARGLKKIQIEGEEEEFLMDGEGNIYNLNGDFIGTTHGDGEAEGEEE